MISEQNINIQSTPAHRTCQYRVDIAYWWSASASRITRLTLLLPLWKAFGVTDLTSLIVMPQQLLNLTQRCFANFQRDLAVLPAYWSLALASIPESVFEMLVWDPTLTTASPATRCEKNRSFYWCCKMFMWKVMRGRAEMMPKLIFCSSFQLYWL